MVDRAALERHQVWLYLAAIAAGLGCGTVVPAAAWGFEAALWPVLALLLYATFTQVPFLSLRAAMGDGRFLAAVLGGNFLAVPALVAGLLPLLPTDPALRLGAVLVLVVPCTDWFITFTHLGGGDVARAIAAAPLLLVVQLALLPLLVPLLAGGGILAALPLERVGLAFALFILLPLALAWWTERQAARCGGLLALAARAPVPLLALVVFLIAAAQAPAVAAALPFLGEVAAAFVLYLGFALGLGLALARAARLAPAAGRTLVFSLGTRNSFVVLPLALALPAGWEGAALAIVLQSLVELLGMLVYLRLLPRLVPAR